MEDRRNRRQRAVRLTDEAVQTLQRRLVEQFQGMHLGGRLTRSARATLLDVSIATAERILNQQGNDRSVLQQAFLSVDLEWDDRFCEPMPRDTDSFPLESTALPTHPAARSNRSPVRRRQLVLLVLATAIVVVPSVTIATLKSKSTGPRASESQSYALMSQASEALESGRRAYHRGEYIEAKRQLQVAIWLSAQTSEENLLAEAYRLDGEILAAEGRFEEALDRYADSMSVRKMFRHDWARASLLEAIAVVEIKLGNLDEAETHLMDSLKGLKKWNDIGGVAATSRTLGILAAAKGDHGAAEKWFVAATDALKEKPDPPMTLDIKAQRALILHKEGQSEVALAALGECLTEWRARGHRRWIATTLLQIAAIHHAEGNREGAILFAAEAKRKFHEVGDQFGARECAGILAQDG